MAIDPPAGEAPPSGNASGKPAPGVSRNRSSFAMKALLTVTLLGGLLGGYQVLEHSFAEKLDFPALHLMHTLAGITASMLIATAIVIYMLQHQRAMFVDESGDPDPAVIEREHRQRRHVRWFIQMRWIAIGFTLLLIAVAVPGIAILQHEALPQLLGWWAALALSNVVFVWWQRRGSGLERQLVVQTVSDLVILTGFLNASGGIENPLYVAYLFHVIIAGILLQQRTVLAITGTAAVLVSILGLGEYSHLLPHYTLLLFPHAHILAPGIHPTMHASHDLLFVVGRTVPFIGVLFLTAYFTTLVSGRLRETENELQRLAARALLDRRHLETVINSTGIAMFVAGRDGNVQWINQRAVSRIGDSEVVSTRVEPPHQHAEPRQCVVCAAEETLDGRGPFEEEWTVPAEGYGTLHFRVATSPVCNLAGEVVQAVLLIEEITQRKALEAEALHSGKLSVLGQLAAGIAHEIGNPLASLDARLRLMKLRPQNGEFIAESLGVLKEQIERIRRIVHGVSHFSANRREGWTVWDLNGVVEEGMRLIRIDEHARQIDFREELGTGLPRVGGVRDQILQVVINLLLNAVEAMPEGGRLEVQTFATRRRVGLMVGDTGTGMDATVRERLFEPFFTTKRDGSGLGLSICYSLVHAHGGTITVTSEPGEGSRFVVHLPPAAAIPLSGSMKEIRQ